MNGRACALVDARPVWPLHRRRVLDLVGADIDGAAHHAREAGRARRMADPRSVAVAVEILRVGREFAIVAAVECATPSLDRDGLDRPAIVGEHAGVELVAVDRRRIERCDGGEDVGKVRLMDVLAVPDADVGEDVHAGIVHRVERQQVGAIACAGAAVPGHDAVGQVERAGRVIDAAADPGVVAGNRRADHVGRAAAAVVHVEAAAIVGDVIGERGVDQRERAGIVDAAAIDAAVARDRAVDQRLRWRRRRPRCRRHSRRSRRRNCPISWC